eukprot:2838776-Amphidinium_carterae.1
MNRQKQPLNWQEHKQATNNQNSCRWPGEYQTQSVKKIRLKRHRFLPEAAIEILPKVTMMMRM